MIKKVRKASPEIRMILAANLRQLREAKGWTQEDLANATGLQKTYISDVEQATINVTLASLETLARGLQCTAAELLQ